MVLIQAGAIGSTPKLYLNGVCVVWTDLQRAIQKRIGRRSDFSVYVSASEDVSMADALNAMDATRGLGCKVTLLTSEPKVASPR